MPSGTGGSDSFDEDVVISSIHFYIADARAAIFMEVSGLEVSLEMTDHVEGGKNDHVHRLIGPAKVSDITLKNGITTNNLLWKWFQDVLQGIYKRQHISIVIVDQKKQPVQTWHFNWALPIKWTGPQMKTDTSAAGIQTVVFTHKGMDFQLSKTEPKRVPQTRR